MEAVEKAQRKSDNYLNLPATRDIAALRDDLRAKSAYIIRPAVQAVHHPRMGLDERKTCRLIKTWFLCGIL